MEEYIRSKEDHYDLLPKVFDKIVKIINKYNLKSYESDHLIDKILAFNNYVEITIEDIHNIMNTDPYFKDIMSIMSRRSERTYLYLAIKNLDIAQEFNEFHKEIRY